MIFLENTFKNIKKKDQLCGIEPKEYNIELLF